MGGMECALESAGGRTSIKYSPLTKNDSIPTVDHCPVSYCTGMNKWSLFSVSLAGSVLLSNNTHLIKIWMLRYHSQSDTTQI